MHIVKCRTCRAAAAAVISEKAYSPEHSRMVDGGADLSSCSPCSPKSPILFQDSACEG